MTPPATGPQASSSNTTDDIKTTPTADKQTDLILHRLKSLLQSQKKPIEASLSCLARLSLELIHTIEKCHQMEAQLKRRIEQHTPAIEGMLSFHCMMSNVLQSVEGKSSKSSLKDIQLKDLVKDITTKAINLISEKYYHAPARLREEPTVQHLIDILREGQIDFYISPGLFTFWDSTLRAELAAHYQLESFSLRSVVRNKADRNQFIDFIGEKLITNLDYHLSAQRQRQERPVCSSFSSHRSSSTDSLADSSSSMSTSFTPR